MSKRRGNPNWGKPEPCVANPTTSSFDAVVKSLGLTPEQWADSSALKKWASQNKDHKYVPQELLQIWGFSVRTGNL